jgi:hypothetical protein
MVIAVCWNILSIAVYCFSRVIKPNHLGQAISAEPLHLSRGSPNQIVFRSLRVHGREFGRPHGSAVSSRPVPLTILLIHLHLHLPDTTKSNKRYPGSWRSQFPYI